MSKTVEMVELVSPYREFQILYPAEAKINFKPIPAVRFKNHFAKVEKDLFEKYIAIRKNFGRDFQIVGKHPRSWVPDHIALANVQAEAKRIGVPVSRDIVEMQVLIQKTESLILAFGIKEEAVVESGKSIFQYVEDYLKEAQTIGEQDPNALNLLIAEAKELGIKIPAKANEKVLTDLIQAEKEKSAGK